jgi:methionyl aminopeptidase
VEIGVKKGKIMINKMKFKEIKLTAEIANKIIDELIDAICPNITTTGHLEEMARKLINRSGAKSAFFGYSPPFNSSPYPFCTCISVNEEIVHGLPSGNRMLKPGDLVTIDLGLKLGGWCADLAKTIEVPGLNTETHNLIKATESAIESVSKIMKDGTTIKDIAIAIEMEANKHDVFVVDGLTGHGIGKHVHEEPTIPNTTKMDCNGVLKEGMVVCVEPMFCEDGSEIELSNNQWTVITKTRGRSSHLEKMFYIKKDGCEMLC